MYVCLDCGTLFEEYKQCQSEPLEYFGFPCREKWSGCPNCESWNTCEVFQCDSCGEYILNDYYKVDDKRFCDNCCIKETFDGGL